MDFQHSNIPTFRSAKKVVFRAVSMVIGLTSVIILMSFTPYQYTLIKSIPIKGALLSTDKLRNGYVVNKNNELFKISHEGETLCKYDNNKLGNISFVGTNNPLKILVYYPDFATIITLDNTLSQTGRINLYEMGTNQVSAACVALDNNIWIFDETTYKLTKFDEKFNVIAQSEDLHVLLELPVKGTFIVEKDNFLYMNDPKIGILVFDTYGTYFKTIPIKGLSAFQKIQDQLIYFKDDKLHRYNLQTFRDELITLPEDGEILDVRFEKDRLFLLKKDRLNVYAF